MQEALKEAIKDAINGYPGSEAHPKGGLPALCDELDLNPGVTGKEINGNAGFKLGADKLMAISRECMKAGGENCDAIDKWWRMEHDIDVQPSSATMEKRIGDAMKEISDVALAHAKAMADGTYSDNDTRDMNREVMEAVVACLRINEGALVENAKARGGRNLRSVG